MLAAGWIGRQNPPGRPLLELRVVDFWCFGGSRLEGGWKSGAKAAVLTLPLIKALGLRPLADRSARKLGTARPTRPGPLPFCSGQAPASR